MHSQKFLSFRRGQGEAIATDKLNISKLQTNFKGITPFGNKDILAFYRAFEPEIKTTTANWRIHELVRSGVLSRIGRGRFILGEGRTFIPHISRKIKILHSKIKEKLPYLYLCIWDTSILNELMQHQPGRHYTLVEVDKDAVESVFYLLKEMKKNVFLNPSQDILSRYASGEKDAIIVRPVVSEAPTQDVDGMDTVTIEKMLVDIFTDDTLFSAQQGSEMDHIFTEAFEKYTINENRMLRYADRRRKKESLDEYLNKVSKFRQQTT